MYNQDTICIFQDGRFGGGGGGSLSFCGIVGPVQVQSVSILFPLLRAAG